MISTPDDDMDTVFGKVLDPVILGMTINDLRIVLEDALERAVTDNERVNSIVLMLTTLQMS